VPCRFKFENGGQLSDISSSPTIFQTVHQILEVCSFCRDFQSVRELIMEQDFINSRGMEGSQPRVTGNSVGLNVDRQESRLFTSNGRSPQNHKNVTSQPSVQQWCAGKVNHYTASLNGLVISVDI